MTVALQLPALLNRRHPTQHGHRNPIGSAQITLQLQLQIIVGIEAQVIIEPSLIVSVAAFHLAVMPWRLGSDRLMDDMKLIAKDVQRMNSLCPLCIRKLAAIIRLNQLGCITEVDNGSLYKIHGTVTAVLPVGIQEAFPACFINHGILVELFVIQTYITDLRYMLYIHLPLLSQLRRRIIVSQMPGFLLRGLHLLPIAEPDKHAVQGSRMSPVSLLLPQLAIHLAYTDIRIAAVVVTDPTQFLLCMGIGMLAVR